MPAKSAGVFPSLGWSQDHLLTPEKLELDVLSATTREPKKIYEDLKAHYGTTEITMREAKAWVRMQGFSNVTVSELHYVLGRKRASHNMGTTYATPKREVCMEETNARLSQGI